MLVSYYFHKILKLHILQTKKMSQFQKQLPEVFYKKALLKNFVIFTGKHLYWGLFSILLKETLTQVALSCEYCEIFTQKICEQLLLHFLLLTVNISSQGLISSLNSIYPFQVSLQGLKSSLQGAQWQVSFLFEKQKNQPKLLLVVTRFHSLSLVVTRYTTRCYSL